MDLFKNFAKVTVSTGYDASATSVVLSGGHGARLPAAPFNATWWNSTDFADPTDDPNVEIVRVTAIASDTLTVTRGQESITASTKNTASKTYKMIAGLTAKTFNTDLGATALQVANGRLTLETGVPVPATDQTAKTTIYFTPYQGNRISLYDGTQWSLRTFTELSLALGTLTADKNYDVFVYSNAGTLTLELSAAWTSDIARADALALQDGIYVKSGATTRLYLGTFRTTSTTTTEDSAVKRFVWNNYNRVARENYKTDATAHSYDGGARVWNGDSTHQIGFVSGLAESAFSTTLTMYMGGAGTFKIAMIGLDSLTTVYRMMFLLISFAAAVDAQPSLAGVIPAQIGYHFLAPLESTNTNGANTFTQYALTAMHLM